MSPTQNYDIPIVITLGLLAFTLGPILIRRHVVRERMARRRARR